MHVKCNQIKKSKALNTYYQSQLKVFSHCIISFYSGIKPAACDLPSLKRTYSQPGDENWPSQPDIDAFSKSIDGNNTSCLGLRKFVYFNDDYANSTLCLNYTGLEPDRKDETCKKQVETPYSEPDDSCDPNPFVTGAKYNDTGFACMTPYQFLNNRNYKKEWMAAFIVTPHSREDIQKAVRFAKKHRLGVSIMSTGHDLQDRNAGAGPNTLLIRTTCFQDWNVGEDSVVYNDEGKMWKSGYAEVGAGLTFGKNFWGNVNNSKGVYLLAADANKEIVGGSCNSVGLVGWTIGGGRGLTSPKYGLGVDQLLHADLVNANGELVSANYTHNKDLFFALRGGGGGFGIIYKMKIKLHTPSCKDGKMNQCYTRFTYNWYGKYTGDKTIEYVKMILEGYLEWSIKNRLQWYSGVGLNYKDTSEPGGHYSLEIFGMSFGDNSTFPSFLSNFTKDKKPNSPSSIKTSKYFCEVFPDATDGDNCTLWDHRVQRWRQNIRNEITAKEILNYGPDSFISTLLDYWRPHCEKYPYSACTSGWAINAATPAIDSATGRGVYNSGGAISPAFRESSFQVLNQGVTSIKLNLTFHQKEEWEHYTLGPAIYPFTNGSYFNEAEYTMEPGQWEERFWGKENHCRLVKIKKTHDPDLTFACRHCIGDEVGYNDE